MKIFITKGYFLLTILSLNQTSLFANSFTDFFSGAAPKALEFTYNMWEKALENKERICIWSLISALSLNEARKSWNQWRISRKQNIQIIPAQNPAAQVTTQLLSKDDIKQIAKEALSEDIKKINEKTDSNHKENKSSLQDLANSMSCLQNISTALGEKHDTLQKQMLKQQAISYVLHIGQMSLLKKIENNKKGLAQVNELFQLNNPLTIEAYKNGEDDATY